MKKIIIILLLILQIFITFVIFMYNPPILITINNKEFNELLMDNTYNGFPKSFFILAILNEKWFRPKSSEILILNEYSHYSLKRGPDNVIKSYIKEHANFRIIFFVFNIIFDLIIIMFSKYFKKSNTHVVLT